MHSLCPFSFILLFIDLNVSFDKAVEVPLRNFKFVFHTFMGLAGQIGDLISGCPRELWKILPQVF